ncbi:MAG: phosphoglycerate kinase [Candidatus Shapirobacteria bacterium]
MKLPSIKDLAIKNKRVLLRVNYDLPSLSDTSRVDESLPTIKYLLRQNAKITLISHSKSSLKPVAAYLSKLLPGVKDCYLRENLRFDPREEANDPSFAKEIACDKDFFINDAFAVSHRKHASIVGLPKILPTAFGFDFLEEIENLSKILENPARPNVLIIGGAKEDKLADLTKLAAKFDQVLIGGRLPVLVSNQLSIMNNLVIAKLNSRGKDISRDSIEQFKKIIVGARTVVLSGPMGCYEEEGSETGTKAVFETIARGPAFSVAGGGDTEMALVKFALKDKIGYISSGGGAMLAFLANGTLPGIEAVL